MPFRFMPISGAAGAAQIAQINKNFAELDREAVTKVFKSGDTELVQGKIDDNRFGTLMRVGGVDRQFDGLYRTGRFASIKYDENGTPISLYGMSPDDGRMGFWQVKPGGNVITSLGG